MAGNPQVREGRVFVAGVLGESHAHVDLALLLASELVTSSVRHNGSAVPGGVVTVTVAAGDEAVRVEVTGRSGVGAPVLSPAAFADADAVGSRGLGLVSDLNANTANRLFLRSTRSRWPVPMPEAY